jgi:hypothetical protein
MPHIATPSHRAQLLAEAVVSAYIDEIARSARPRRRAAAAAPRRPAPPRRLTAARALAPRRRPVAVELGA